MKKLYYLPAAILYCLLTCLLNYTSVNAQNYQWAAGMGGTSDDYGQAVTTDASGNVYTTGFFQGTVYFDPGAGTANLVSAGGYDIFIQKLDAL